MSYHVVCCLVSYHVLCCSVPYHEVGFLVSHYGVRCLAAYHVVCSLVSHHIVGCSSDISYYDLITRLTVQDIVQLGLGLS